MEAIQITGFCLLAAMMLIASILAIHGIRCTEPRSPDVDFRRDELAECLRKLAERGQIHTRIVTTSLAPQSSSFARLTTAIATGCLQPIKYQTQVHFRLWAGNDTTVVIAQHGRSICVFKIEPGSRETARDWIAIIIDSLNRSLSD